MNLSQILIVGGSLVLWMVGLGTIAASTSTLALRKGVTSDQADAIAGVMVLVYLAVSAIGLGLYL